jgi:carboxypeptidase C (cathepsin A)
MSRIRISVSVTLSLLLALALSIACSAGAPPADAKSAEAKSGADAAKDDKKSADDEPVLSVTAHTITVGGKTIKYHATAGYMVLKSEEGKDEPPAGPGPKEGGDKKDADANKMKDNLKPKAKVFFTAYTLDDVADPASRPLTFAFNGGPGSSSVWLHMASVAPRRAALTPEGEAPPPPYKLADNESTWLDLTDLVFIDPVSTGYSRPMPKEDAKQFHGLKEDIASVGDFIRMYISRNSRWLSPKIVMGESYGTTRAAGLSDYLQNRYGLYLNGIILVSSVLNFQTLEFSPQNNEPYVDFLPSYATTAWYHHRLSPELQAMTVEQVAAAARAFAGSDYAMALMRGDAVSAEDRRRVAEQMSRFTGLPVSQLALLKLRLKDGMFFSELLKDQGRVVGRFDARFTGLSYAPGETGREQYDPSDEAVNGPLTAAFNDYVRRELKFESDLPYETMAEVFPWNFGDAGGGFPNTAEDLRRAMTRNPYLKVWITCSYYDLATPFFGAENVVASMNLDPSVRLNLTFTYYESGHMLYIHQASREKFKRDFAAFLKDATSQPVSPAAARVGPAGK